MKRFLIALFAIALIAGAPLVAQYEDPEVDETQTELQAEGEVEADVQNEDVSVEAELQTEDDELGTEDDLGTEDEFGTEDDLGDDELPATGSELPLAGLLGLLSLAGAIAIRARS